MRRAVAAALLAASLGPSASWAGGGACSVFDAAWKSNHDSVEFDLKSAVDDFSKTIASANRETAEQIVSAVRVLTSQRAHTDNQIATTDHKANEASASAITANMTRLAVIRAQETYGDPGQPPDACDVAEQLAELNQAVANRREAAQQQVTSTGIDARAGGVVDVAASTKRRLDEANATTLDVAKSLLSPSASAAEKDDFINFLAGFPIQKIPVPGGGVGAGAGDIEGFQQNAHAARLEAFRSPALYALGAIRASSEKTEGSSVDERLEWLMSRYGGGPSHERWQASLATKSEVGIIKEIARLRAITMTIRRMNNESDGRLAVIFAGLIAQEADRE